MKRKYFVMALLAALVSFSTCNKKNGKSSDCEITSFKVGDDTWIVGSGAGTSANPISIAPQSAYKKGTNVSNLVPIIVHTGAKIEPSSGTAQDFSNDKAIIYTVTAADGETSKTYRAIAPVALE